MDLSGLPAHFEYYFGEIEDGFGVHPDGYDLPFQIVRYPYGSGVGSFAYSTLGLSKHELHAPNGVVHRQELLLLLTDDFRDALLPSVLHQIGEQLLSDHHLLQSGDVLGPAGPIVEGSSMEAFFAFSPVYQPDEFALFEGVVTIVWLVPISAAEAAYIRTQGVDEFVALLVAQDPNLMDLRRDSVV